MHFMKKYILSLILIFSFFNLFSDQLLEKVKTKYLEIKTLESNLSQTNNFTLQDISLVSNGKLFINNTNLVIEYTKPHYQFIKATDEFLTIYSKNENTAFITESNNQVITTLLHFHSLVSQDSKFIKKIDNLHHYQILKPIEPLKELHIFIDATTELITRISYIDDMDNVVTLDFSEQKLNSRLSKTIESFIIPSNVNIIYQ